MTTPATESGTCPVMHLDHHTPEWTEQRHEILAKLRSDSPIVRSDAYGGFYAVVNYAAGRHVLRDDASFSVSRFPDGTGGLLIPSVMKAPQLRPGELDGAEHLAYRKALHEKFKEPVIAKLEDWIRQIVTETLDAVIAKGDFDAVVDLTAVVPARVILEYLGLPSDHHEEFLHGLALGFAAAPDPQEAADANERFQAMWQEMREVVKEKRLNPGDDVISHLSRCEDPKLDDDQLLSVVCNLALGGTLTTTAWLGYAMVQLEEDRELRHALIDDASKIPSFGEEVLRFFTPASALARNVTAEVEVNGVQMHPGDRVLVVIPSANRDAETFEDAEQFDPERPRKHLSFGIGAHFCVGVHLARLEFRVFMQELLARVPHYSIDLADAQHAAQSGVTARYVSLPAHANLDASELSPA